MTGHRQTRGVRWGAKLILTFTVLACSAPAHDPERNLDIEGDGEAGDGGSGTDVSSAERSGSGGADQGAAAAGKGGLSGSDGSGSIGAAATGGTDDLSGTGGVVSEPGAGGAGGQSVEPPTPVLVDRFANGTGTFFVRGSNALPGPGAALDLDVEPFLVALFGPSGQTVYCYNLDVQARDPAFAYEVVFEDGASSPTGQRLIFDEVPGDAGYSDFRRIVEVRVTDDYEPNTLRSVDDLIDHELPLEPTDRVVNQPVVPPGSRARFSADGEGAAPRQAWYRGEPVGYFVFDEPSLTLTEEKLVPVASMFAAFNENPNAENPLLALPSGFFGDGEPARTHNVLAALPGAGDYSPLVSLQAYDNSEFSNVLDLASAQGATLLASDVAMLNCPVVAVE
ncbi:MAG TPA: hypothetical protein VF989_12280 [Polyangiaceae bacterium]